MRKIVVLVEGQKEVFKEVFKGDNYILDTKPMKDSQPILRILDKDKMTNSKPAVVALFYKWTFWRILEI